MEGTPEEKEQRAEPRDQPPAPERRIITLRSEYAAAVGMLLPMAQRELRIFDPDLANLGLHTEDSVRRLRALLIANRHNRVFIAVHRIDFITRRASRLVDLLATFSASIFVHQTVDDAAIVEDCFVLCDEEHFVRRAVAAQPRGALYLSDPKEGRSMRERFDQVWEKSFLAVTATQIGL
jgi:hypothetical protein